MENQEVVKPWILMTREERKVFIAKDVLARLDAKKLVAKHQVWTSFRFDFDEGDKEIRDVLKEKAEKGPCMACALGAMFLSKVDAVNQLKVLELREHQFAYPSVSIQSSDILKYLSDAFDHVELREIESAFESGEGNYTSDNAYDFFPGYRDGDKVTTCGCDNCKKLIAEKQCIKAEDRMRILMNNIIDNNGKFDANDKRRIEEWQAKQPINDKTEE